MDLTDLEKEIILACAENDMNLSRVARELYMSRAAVGWYIPKIKAKTGLSIRKFYDLVKLVKMVKND